MPNAALDLTVLPVKSYVTCGAIDREAITTRSRSPAFKPPEDSAKSIALRGMPDWFFILVNRSSLAQATILRFASSATDDVWPMWIPRTFVLCSPSDQLCDPRGSQRVVRFRQRDDRELVRAALATRGCCLEKGPRANALFL